MGGTPRPRAVQRAQLSTLAIVACRLPADPPPPTHTHAHASFPAAGGAAHWGGRRPPCACCSLPLPERCGARRHSSCTPMPLRDSSLQVLFPIDDKPIGPLKCTAVNSKLGIAAAAHCMQVRACRLPCCALPSACPPARRRPTPRRCFPAGVALRGHRTARCRVPARGRQGATCRAASAWQAPVSVVSVTTLACDCA